MAATKPFQPLSPAEPQTPAVPPAKAAVIRHLHALATAASGYLRLHPDRQVRRAIALLAAATLAASTACGPATDFLSGSEAAPTELVVAEQAMPQANFGFPPNAGSYELRPSSLQMDTGGTYYFWWYTSGTGGAINMARGSDVQLIEDERTFLQVESGKPILHLKPDEPVALVAPGEAGAAAPAQTVAASGGGGMGFFPLWYPFMLGGLGGNTAIGGRTPGYYAPPGTTDIGPGGRVEGATRTATAPTAPPAFKLKTTTVSGRAGGTGSGTAATGKAGDAASRIGAPRSTGFSSGSGASSGGSSIS